MEAPVISAVLFRERRAMMSPECEDEHFRARREELNFELPAFDRCNLADELKHALAVELATPVRVDVDAVRVSRRLAVDGYAKRDRGAARPWTHDEMQVARMK